MIVGAMAVWFGALRNAKANSVWTRWFQLRSAREGYFTSLRG
jgi:hypothetical protein